MAMKLSTTLSHITTVPNSNNSKVISEFYHYMKSIGTSENYQNQNLKAIIVYAKFLGPDITFNDIQKREQIVTFLDTKIKSNDIDPDKRWITTWNDYLWRIKYFLRWFHNHKLLQDRGEEPLLPSDWITPSFATIKKRKTKRLSPYLETELWERDELLYIIKYEPYKRNKAALALLWDLDARPHEVTLLKIKHIRLRERYGEGEIPHEAKTGTGPILLTCSFPYVRDWLNEHPFRNEPEARLICDLNTGGKIRADVLNDIMKLLRKRIIRLLESGEIIDKNESEKLRYIVDTKKFNPYCIRHSSICIDSDWLPDFALKKKVRWSMNSRQGLRYIKNRMGNDLKQKILVQNGIVSEIDANKNLSVLRCPRCTLINAVSNKYCSKCSYPLTPAAYEEIRIDEEKRIQDKYEKEIKKMRQEIRETLKNEISELVTR